MTALSPKKVYFVSILSLGCLGLCALALSIFMHLKAYPFLPPAEAANFAKQAKMTPSQAHRLAAKEQARLDALIPTEDREITGIPLPLLVYATTENGQYFFPSGSLHHIGTQWTSGYFVNPENSEVRFEQDIVCKLRQVVDLPRTPR